MTFPHGTYVAVVDVDRETGEVRVRRFLAVDDCGTVINPLVVEGPYADTVLLGSLWPRHWSEGRRM